MTEFMRQMPTIFKGSAEDKKISSKRVITFILTMAFIVIVAANVFFGFEIEEFIYNGLVEVIIWALAFIGSEQFAGAMKGRRWGNKSRRYDGDHDNPEMDLPPRP